MTTLTETRESPITIDIDGDKMLCEGPADAVLNPFNKYGSCSSRFAVVQIADMCFCIKHGSMWALRWLAHKEQL